MINIFKVRSLYESRRTRQGGRGRLQFVNEMRHQLGLCDKNGSDYKDRAGNRILKNPTLRPDEFSLQEMAEAIVGPAWRIFFNPTDQGSLNGFMRHKMLCESQYPGDPRALMEATGIGVDPSAFLDINAFTSVTGGLIEVKILENFKSPEFIADYLAPAEPTKLNGQKIINAARIGAKGLRRNPNEPHARAQFGERYVTTPATRENALAVDITKEAVFYDLGTDLMRVAGDVGEWLGFQKDLDVIDCFIGVSSGVSGGSTTLANNFNYKGTAYTMYSATAQLGYTNQLAANGLTDWTSIESSWKQFVRATDPETSTRIYVRPDTILVNPAKVATAELICNAMRTERRTAGSSTQSTAATLQIADTPGVPDIIKNLQVIWSPLVEQRCTDSGLAYPGSGGYNGLNLSQSNADLYWWHFQRGRPLKWMQNWPLTTWQFSGGQYEMLDKGIIATYGANERGVAAVVSPWHVVMNTN